MRDPQAILARRAVEAIVAACGEDLADVDPQVRLAQDPRFGDYQINVAMALAKRLGRKPRDIAQDIVTRLSVGELCEGPQIAGPGFINLTLRRSFLEQAAAQLATDPHLTLADPGEPVRTVVDYSGPNVAKEMHVGHLRSSVIGDSIVRVLEALGHPVIRQNHLGDWGTQFGMLIECMIECGAADQPEYQVSDLNALYQQAKRRFDEDVAFADRARRRVVALQRHEPQTLELWRRLVRESERHFEQAYTRLGVRLRRDDVRGESAYNDRLAGVVDDLLGQGIAVESEGAVVVFVEPYEAPMIVRKRDGGYGYDATDLAALRYRVTDLAAQRVIYVTDARQREHFDKVFAAAGRAGWLEGVAAEHVTFGTVLGEDGKPFKTRSGETVKLADLLDEAEQRAAAVVAEKNPDLEPSRQRQVARVVGIGAIKYADLSSERTRDYVFSWDRMLAMDGNTAPYLQYAYARIRSIFRRADLAAGDLADARIIIAHEAERALVMKLMQLGPVARSVASSLQPHHLCTYLYELATTFSGFYENCPVLRAEDDASRMSRLGLCDLTARTLRRGLDLLGIDVLEQM